MTMKRRGFFGAIAASAAAVLAPPSRATYGKLTVDGWMQHYRSHERKRELAVFVDGEDVTFRCRAASDRKGYAVVMRDQRKLASGGYVFAGWQVLRGRVEIVERPATRRV